MQILAWKPQARYTDNEATSSDSGRFLYSDDRKALATPLADESSSLSGNEPG
jgi:hypothetical protein